LPPGFQRVKDVVEASFAHRRKRLPNSLELSGLSDRGRAEAALAELGKPAAVRAQELQPAEFLRLAQVLA
jgi:16S rRNA A1518/A1519 N6-dimethyltransferase RsmA/KsgA/DIM1 with predicted DNA glycosylase/AP lyase activity